MINKLFVTRIGRTITTTSLIGAEVLGTYDQRVAHRRFRSYLHGPEFTNPKLNKIKIESNLEKIKIESNLEKIKIESNLEMKPEIKLETTDHSYVESLENFDSSSDNDWGSDGNWDGVSDFSLSKAVDWFNSKLSWLINKFTTPEVTLPSYWAEDLGPYHSICNFSPQEMFHGIPYIYIWYLAPYLGVGLINLVLIILLSILLNIYLYNYVKGLTIKLYNCVKGLTIKLYNCVKVCIIGLYNNMKVGVIELSVYVGQAITNNFTYITMSDDYDTSNNSLKRKIIYSGGSGGDDGREDKEKNKKGHYLEGLSMIDCLILLKGLVDLIRSYRIRLLGGTLNIGSANPRLAGRIRMVGSSLANQHLNAHVDLSEYPILDSYINNNWNPTLMDGLSPNIYDVGEMHQAEDAFATLDELSRELERVISELNSEVSDDSDTY